MSENTSNNGGHGDTSLNNGRVFKRRIRTFEHPEERRPAGAKNSANSSEFDIPNGLLAFQERSHFAHFSAQRTPLPAPDPAILPHIPERQAEMDERIQALRCIYRAEHERKYGPVQAKTLSVSQPDDPQEKEADRMADRVLRMEALPEEEEVQRAETPEEEELQREAMPEDEDLQREAMPEDEELQREKKPEEEEIARQHPSASRPVQANTTETALYRALAELSITPEPSATPPSDSGYVARMPGWNGTRRVQGKVIADSQRNLIRLPTGTDGIQRVLSRDARGIKIIERHPPGRDGVALQKVYRMTVAEAARAGALGQTEEPGIQLAADGELQTSADTATRIEAKRGGGETLGASEREFFENRMDADFSGVRIHRDAEAASLAKDVNAKAFTIGGDVFFGEGQYQPGSSAGKKLIAHELTHTVQQGAAERVAREGEGSVEAREEKVARFEIESAQISQNRLAIKFAELNSPPNETQIWKLLDEKILRLERNGLRYTYAELYPEAPGMKRAGKGVEDFTFHNPELGEVATVRIIRDPGITVGPGESEPTFRPIVFIPLVFADGTRLVFQEKTVDPGTIRPDAESTIETATTDYAAQASLILDALSGVTTYADSERIMAVFRSSDAATIRTLLHRLKLRGPEQGKTPAEMIDWLFEDLSANHREELKDMLIRENIVEDLVPVVAAEMLNGADAAEIEQWVLRFHGAALDRLLGELQNRSGKSRTETALWLFEALETLAREKVRAHFLMSGPVARDFALSWTAGRINDLLEGHTGILDSGSIVWNFRQLPDPQARAAVLARLGTGEAGDIHRQLMKKLQPEDYAKLQTLGLPLRANEGLRDGLDTALEAAEWASIAVEVQAGGLVGIVSGAVEFGAEFLEFFIDIPIAIYHFFMAFLFIASKGAVGSDSILKIEEFLQGIEGLVMNPRAVLEQAYADTMTESEAFEGPVEAFKRAEFWGRKVTKFILAVIVIVKGARALAKRGVPEGKVPKKGRKEKIRPDEKTRTTHDEEIGGEKGKAPDRDRKEEETPRIETLREPSGEDLLDEYEGYFKANKEHFLTDRQKKILIAKGAKGLILKDWISLQKLWELGAKTKVEWAMQDFNGKILLISGEPSSVGVRLHKTVKRLVHTHFRTHLPSQEDYEVWVKLKTIHRAPIESLEIVLNGLRFSYNQKELEILQAAGQLKKFEDPHRILE